VLVSVTDDCAVREMRTKLKLISDGDNSGSKKYKRGCGGTCGGTCGGSGGVCVWRESGIRRSVCVAAFGRKFASIVVKVFSHLIYSQYNFINVVL
jgi:hypothetical protein